MKNFVKFLMPAAVAALALVSCNKEKDFTAQAPNAVQIRVHAIADELNAGDPESKTYIGTYQGVANTILWGTGEYMKLALGSGDAPFTKDNTAFGTSNSSSADAWNGEDQAEFEFSITPKDENATSFTLMGLYPASAFIESSNENPQACKVNLPATQNATASSYDPAAYIMVAKPESFETIQTDWVASYRRATALNKITLTNIPEDIVSVEFTAPTGKFMAGRRYIDLTTGESGETYGDTRTETIEVKSALSGSSKVVWFTSWGIEIASGEKFKIVAKSATKSYTRELTAREGGIKFMEGFLNTLNVNMSSADVETLESYEGEYLIVASAASPIAWRIMTPTNNNDYYTVLETSIGTEASSLSYDSFSSVSDISDNLWTVSKITGGYSIRSNSTSKYISLTTDGNKAYASESPEAFDLTIDHDSHAAVVKSQTYTSRVLRYNSGSPRFAFYSGTNQPIYMIKYDTRTPVALSFSESSISKTADNYNEFTGQVASADPDVNAITSNISYSMTGDNIGSVNSSSGVVSLNGTTGTATVTASFAGDDTYMSASASYTITVAAGIQTVTVSEFIAASESAENWYRLTGTISDIVSTLYGNFTLTDGTGSVYVYGLTSTQQTSNDKSFASLGLEEGYTVTIIAHRSSHNNTPQAGGAYYESHVPIPTLKVSPTELVFDAAGESKNVTATATNFDGSVTISASSDNAQFSTSVSGSTVIVTAAANQGNSAITGTITVTATDGATTKTATVNVSQNVPVQPASDGDILWQEDFTDYGTTMPATATGAHVYGGGTVTYSLTNGAQTTALNDGTQYSGGTSAPELLISKSNGTYTISGIPTGRATSMYLTFKSNHGDYCTVSSGTTGITVGTSSVSSGVVTTTISATSSVTSFDLTITNTNSSNTRVDDFVLKVGTPPVILESIAVSGQTTSFTKDDDFSFGGTVTATYSDGSTADVTSSSSFSGYDMSNTGSQTVTVSYTEDGVTKTTTYTITVSAGGGGFTPVSFSWSRNGTTDTVTSGYTLTTSGASGKSGFYQDSSGTVSLALKQSNNNAIFTTSPSSISLTVSLGAGSANATFTNSAYACLVDANGDEITSTVTAISGSTSPGSTSGTSFNVSIPVVSSAYGVKVRHAKESGVNMRYFSISFYAN